MPVRDCTKFRPSIEKTNAEIETVAKGVGMDKRIGSDFLKAGIGYGGFCFPKDLDALIHILKKNELDAGLFEKVRDINYGARNHFVKRVCGRFERAGGLEGKIIGVLGLAFKPNTDDMRLAPSIDINALSTALRLSALLRVSSCLNTPITSLAACFFFIASPTEPPISPTPIIATLLNCLIVNFRFHISNFRFQITNFKFLSPQHLQFLRHSS